MYVIRGNLLVYWVIQKKNMRFNPRKKAKMEISGVSPLALLRYSLNKREPTISHISMFWRK